MIQLFLFLALGVIFLVVLYLFIRRSNVRAEGGAEALIEARQALNSLQTGLLPPELVQRVFARDDLDFVSSTVSPNVREIFLRERKRMALSWIAHVRRGVLSLWQFYSGQSRQYAQLDMRTELALAVNFASLLVVCRVLQALFYLRGPYAAPRMVGRAIAAAENVCVITERSLSFLTPDVNAFQANSRRDRAET